MPNMPKPNEGYRFSHPGGYTGERSTGRIVAIITASEAGEGDVQISNDFHDGGEVEVCHLDVLRDAIGMLSREYDELLERHGQQMQKRREQAGGVQ